MDILIYCGLAALMLAGVFGWALWLDKQSKSHP